MKFIKFFVVVLLLLLNGCGSDDEKNEKSSLIDETKEDSFSQNSKKMTIEGKTTLAKATVCIDRNKNTFCDEDEPQSTSDVIGRYLLESEVKDGDIILSQGGFNLILLEENTQNLAVKASFNAKNEKTNLDTLSSLIADSIEKDGNYEDAKARIAKKNGLDITLIEKNPFDLIEANEDEKIFLTIRAIEERVLYPEGIKSKKQKLSLHKLVNNTLIITEKEADDALFGYDVFSFSIHSGFLVSFYFYVANYFEDSDTTFVLSSIRDKVLYTGALTACYLFGAPCPEPSSPVFADENDSVSEELVLKEELVGIWKTNSNLKKENVSSNGERVFQNNPNYCIDISRFVFTTYKEGEYLSDSFDTDNILIEKRDNLINFDEGYRLLDMGRSGTYYVTKSDLVEDKLYFNRPIGHSSWTGPENKTLSLTKYNSLEDCLSKRDEDKKQNIENFNVTIKKIKDDISENTITREKLNGVWYHKVFEKYNTYSIECFRVNANDTIEHYFEEGSNVNDLTFDNKSPTGTVVEDAIFSNIGGFGVSKVYTSKSNEDTLYLKSAVADIGISIKVEYEKLILQPDLESCIAKINEQ